MKRTKSLVLIATALMDQPTGPQWGYDLSKRAGVRSGVLYPTLRRMLEEGWLEDGWEDPTAIQGRPPRRYYKLTPLGCQELGGIAASTHSSSARPRPAGRLAFDG